jgi:hypothetical protein
VTPSIRPSLANPKTWTWGMSLTREEMMDRMTGA